MKALRFTPLADADLSEAASFIARDNPKAAERFLRAIEADCQNLCRHPDLGNERYRNLLPEVGPVRFWPVSDGFSNWLIFYSTAQGDILVLRILHGSRDLPGLFP